MNEINNKLRNIPSVDIILSQDWVEFWFSKIGRSNVKRIINQQLSIIRSQIISDNKSFTLDDFKNSCLEKFYSALQSSLKRVINATGVVIHTNLGRSLISDEAIDAMNNISRYYSNLEYDIQKGSRGHRNSHIENLLCDLTGSEAAFVVNNNAAAVLLCLCALAKNSEVIVSRGELVEIGGSFRIPDIMALSGAKLVEVGTTNRTHLKDYENAITENTSMLLKIHPSNFKIEGFTTSPERKDLSELAHSKNLIFMEDSGSGLLINGDLIGLPKNSPEITIKETLNNGADLVTFSGDKILGAPQIGGIVGKKNLISKIKSHQMARALRVDKATLAGFEATLRIYSREDYDSIPTLRMLRLTDKTLKEIAENLALKITQQIQNQNIKLNIIRVNDAVGGGSYPETPLNGWGVSLKTSLKSSGELQNSLRENNILCAAHDDEIVFHVRTLQNGEDDLIIEALRSVLNA